jgi:hypothetical protein
MSAFGTKLTSRKTGVMFALGGKADIDRTDGVEADAGKAAGSLAGERR